MKILLEAFKEDLILFDLDVESKEKLFELLFEKLKEKNIVKNTYLQALIEREKIYPTGLLLNPCSVAIPHTDSIHVLENAIAIAKLKKPINFKYMANPEMDVEVQLVFMLAIKDPKNQVPTLSALMDLLSNKDNLQQLISSKNKIEFLKIIEDKEVNR